MKTKCHSHLSIYEELNEKYGEWLEMGIPAHHFLLNMLHNEREKVRYLESEILYYKRKRS